MSKPATIKLNVNIVDEQGQPSTLKAEIEKWVANGAGSLKGVTSRLSFKVVRDEPALAWSSDIQQ